MRSAGSPASRGPFAHWGGIDGSASSGRRRGNPASGDPRGYAVGAGEEGQPDVDGGEHLRVGQHDRRLSAADSLRLACPVGTIDDKSRGKYE